MLARSARGSKSKRPHAAYITERWVLTSEVGSVETFLASAILSVWGEGNIDMNDITIGFDLAEEDILTYEVSDETVESAAVLLRDRAGSVTVSFCSGLDSCPS